MAFEFNFEQEVESVLPGNGEDKTKFRVANILSSLALKGQALGGRAKQKDAYDIFALTHYKGGPKEAAENFNKLLKDKNLSVENTKMLKHSLSVIREKFLTENKSGPFAVENFSENRYKQNVVAEQVGIFLEDVHLQ